MDRTPDPIAVDAERLIARLRTQFTDAWGQTQVDLALAREETAVRAAQEEAKDQRIAELEAALAELQNTSTRP
ncbi:hypothetical protein OG196_31900 [Kitasatospora purpeofusca]|uniref:hypothetical protein n=1 Tax=Kitasatospora purpeofusca TaxID=67352 RepID=UPI002E14F192|nr:hypothetical protein OG196_31900 [Kitasatospora purpeofusca]